MNKRILTSLLAAWFCGILNAQSNNALDFDGVDDQVTVLGGSERIANASAMTLACWVFPRNAAPGYPDFDGFAGMRNEVDCDFYLLQVSPSTDIEGRFRNSNGEVFTITASGLELNTWQHLALVYDGSALTLYHGGSVLGSIPANGSITNVSTPLLIGDVEFGSTEFYLNGKVDEVSLWSRALSAGEISCMAAQGADVADADLQLYYKFDQGTAGGNNIAITQATDGTGHIAGDLNSFALSGAGSNFVQGATVGTLVTAQICPGESYSFNGEELSTAGAYTAAYDVGGTCDSVVTLVLSVVNVNTNVIQVGNTLTALSSLGPYHWIDCNTNTAIAGATGQSYTATQGGDYAVVVTSAGCSDTSSCFHVGGIGIDELHRPIVSIHPVPASDQLQVDLDVPLIDGLLTVIDAQGREVMDQRMARVRSAALDVSALPSGMYTLRLNAHGVSEVQRFNKQ